MSDLRDALRALRTTPLVTLVALLSLGLGIGANTAMFSVLDALVLRDLPVRYADRLTMLFDDVSRASFWSHPVWESIRTRPIADGAFAFSGIRLNLAERGEVDPADGLFASGGMFEVMGVDAIVGRTFTEVDDRPGGGPDGPVAVISHGFWQRRYGGVPDAVGRTIRLDGASYTIVGVTGPRFSGPEVGRSFDVAIPLNTEPLIRGARSALGARTSSWLQIMFRLAEGQTAAQATQSFRAAQPGIRDETRPVSLRPEDQARHLANPLTVRDGGTVGGIRDQYERPVKTLMAIVALTLLIACGNIANLLLARGIARRHEFSVRSALGASTGRLARQVLAESLVLSAAGAALGVVLAILGSRFLVAQLSSMTNRVFNSVFIHVAVDWRMLGFTAALAVGTALLFGLAPALRLSRAAPIDAMKEQGRGSASRGGATGALVVAQVAVSFVLLVGAGLFVRTYAALAGRDAGLDRGGILTTEIAAERAGADSAARTAMYQRVLDEVAAMPSVTSVALSTITPLSGSNSTRRMVRPGEPMRSEAERRTWINFVTPGWFGVMGTRLAAGRDFARTDQVGAPPVVIVNQAFARLHFGDGNPLGRLIAEEPAGASTPAPMEIVGVVEDAVYRSLREPVPPTMYWPLAQQVRPAGTVTMMVRARAGVDASLSRAVAAQVAGVNRDLVTTARPFAEVVDAAVARERLIARLSFFFGVLALVLAALGLYGITAYAVNRRRTEIGIRMALGTTPAAAMALVGGRVARLVALGLGIGLVVSWWLAPFAEGLLFEVSPRDRATLAGSAGVLALVAVVASWWPARRAARIQPAEALRAQS